jgi:guanylate kinase
MRQYLSFDYLIVNDVFERALHELESIILAARLTVAQQSERQYALLMQLLNGTPE